MDTFNEEVFLRSMQFVCHLKLVFPTKYWMKTDNHSPYTHSSSFALQSENQNEILSHKTKKMFLNCRLKSHTHFIKTKRQLNKGKIKKLSKPKTTRKRFAFHFVTHQTAHWNASCTSNHWIELNFNDQICDGIFSSFGHVYWIPRKHAYHGVI